MGNGCKSVVRAFTPDTDVVVGIWEDNRIGSFRGIRAGKAGYGGTVFGEKGLRTLGPYGGYKSLLVEITRFFKTGIVPVKPEETLNLLAFMEAADESKIKGGVPVEIQTIMERAKSK